MNTMTNADRTVSLRAAVYSVAYATGCMLEPTISRPGASVLRLCAQAPNATVAQLFASRVSAELGATVEVTPTPYGTYDCNIAVEM